jgi:glucosamine kinase
MGAAGAGRRKIAKAVRRILAEIVGGEIEVVGDMEIALEAAFGAGPGIIVIAGTGSIAHGRAEKGRTARAGGWGFGISDEGSAHWIGREAVRSLLRRIDEKVGDNNAEAVAQKMPLFREIQEAWGLKTLDGLWRTANAAPDFAELFPAILKAADGGDKLSAQILDQAGGELARLAAVVGRCLFRDAKATEIAVATAGGVFRYSERVRRLFRRELREQDPKFLLKADVVDPVHGALQMARGVSVKTAKAQIVNRRER